MDARNVELAADFCEIVGAPDLLSHLGLTIHTPEEERVSRLQAERRRMQGMQGNPKYKTQARFFIKHRAALEAVVRAPAAHLDDMARRQEEGSLPTLIMAIDGILADGRITPEEYQYARELATTLGFGAPQFEKLLEERATAAGVPLPSDAPTPVLLQSIADGSQQLLRADAARGGWDTAFVETLLAHLPESTNTLVDVYCRKAMSALCLCPRRPGMRFLGLDRNRERIRIARRSIASLGGRARLQEGPPTPIPLKDGSTDAVLAVRALQNLTDTRMVFREARRVLVAGGRLVVVEPDSLAEQFYFGAHLPEITDAYRPFAMAIEERYRARGPAGGEPGFALGPQLGERLGASGLSARVLAVHVSMSFRRQTRSAIARRIRGYVSANAGAVQMTASDPTYQNIMDVIRQFEAEGPDDVAMAGNMLPLFIGVGVKA